MTIEQDYFVNVVNAEPIPVTLGSENITITGDVNIGTTVSVTSTPEDPIHTHISEVGTSGILTRPNLPVSIQTATGDENSSEHPVFVEWVYGDGSTIIPWQVQVARGKIAGVSGLSISGYNADVGTSYVPLWNGTTSYTYLNTATQLTVWSTSASDTNVSVLISGLDSNYAPITETIVLTNGVTGVTTTQSFFRVNNMSLTRTPMNVGVIKCGNNGKTTVLCTIEAAAGRSQQTIYTVPAGYTFFLTQSNWYTNNTGNNTGLYRSWTQSPTGVVNIVLVFPFPVNYNSLKVVPRAYAEKTDIQWQVSSKSGAAAVGGQIEGYLIANSAL